MRTFESRASKWVPISPVDTGRALLNYHNEPSVSFCYSLTAFQCKVCPVDFKPLHTAVSPLPRLPTINNRVRSDGRRSVVPVTVVLEIDLRDALLHALHEVVEQAQAVRVRRLAARDARERHRSVVQKEADVGRFVACGGGRGCWAGEHLPDEVGGEWRDVVDAVCLADGE